MATGIETNPVVLASLARDPTLSNPKMLCQRFGQFAATEGIHKWLAKQMLNFRLTDVSKNLVKEILA